ncbi:MAG: cytochrome P450, partial [Chloroflexota bacterium]
MLQEAEAPIKQLPREHGIPIIGSAHEFMSANGIPIDFLSRVQQQHGDVAQFKVINRTMILVSDPDLVHEILVKRVHEFPKPSAVVQKPRGIMRFLGKGILTAGYAEWKPQRQLMQPFMHRKHIESYAQTMANLTETLLLQWQDGAERNIHSDMTQLTMWIIADTMFGLGMNQLTDFEDLVTRAQKIIINDFVGILPNWLTGQSTAAADVNAQMTEFVRQMIADYDGSERNDLLSLLLNYRDEDGKPLSD